MKALNPFLILVVAGASVAAMPQSPSKTPQKITSKHAERALGNGRSSVVFFFTAGCPHNPQGVKDVNRLTDMIHRQYGVYGMTNLSQKDAETYLKKLGAKFRILGDPTGKRIADFGATHSLDLIVLRPDGEVQKRWIGYDRGVIAQLARELSKFNGPPITVNLSAFPAARQSGCGFPTK